MLQAMRNKMHGWPSIIILGVAVLAMSLFGMQSYFTSQADNVVAKVGKHEITRDDYQDRTNQLRQQESQQEGDKFDASAFEKPEVKQQIVEGMIEEQILLQANNDWGMRVSDQAIRDAIASAPVFQLNGKFDPTAYRTWLESQRKTPAMLENDIRSSMAASAIPDAITASTIITGAEVDAFLKLLTQKRSFSYLVLPQPKLADQTVTDAQIQSYYKAHLADYMTPEQVSVKYIEVKGSALNVPPPTDDELQKRYQDEKQRFVQPEQRLVSHILINVPANATPAQQKAALAKADKIAAEANPADFAKLAEQDSQDLGSRRQGGDLGWLEKGVTNAAFDSAMFGLKKGEISKPVLSPDGYHIIWLRDIRSGDSKPFADVRDQLVKEATKADQERKYNEVAGKLSDNAYQNPSSLEPAATALNLPIESTALFSRDGGQGIAANPKFVAAAFGDDVVAQGNNSNLIKLSDSDSAVLHIEKHLPEAAKPLADVRADVQKKILDERVAVAEKKQADGMLRQLQKGAALPALASASGATVKHVDDIQRGRSSTVPPALATQVFLTPHPVKGRPEYAVVDMQDGSYAVLSLEKVEAGDLSKISKAEHDAMRDQMVRAYGTEARNELVDALKSRTKIKINRSLL